MTKLAKPAKSIFSKWDLDLTYIYEVIRRSSSCGKNLVPMSVKVWNATYIEVNDMQKRNDMKQFRRYEITYIITRII